MTVAILDTTVVIHLFRKNQTALAWFSKTESVFSITPMTWMEIMVGVANKRAQADIYSLMNGFEMIYPTSADMDWAMAQMLVYRFSHGLGVMDCFIASVSRRLNLPVYTHNRKDYLKILPAELVVTPYV